MLAVIKFPGADGAMQVRAAGRCVCVGRFAAVPRRPSGVAVRIGDHGCAAALWAPFLADTALIRAILPAVDPCSDAPRA